MNNFFGNASVIDIMLISSKHKSRDEEIAVFDDNGKEFRPSLYFSKEMKQNLGLTSGFPSALTLNPAPKLAVPAISFEQDCSLIK